ncbi:MAG TPA: DUF1501 domain-containing protein [Isosphaeraceae bacterium]|nr:DUF1501 domain-containing protein [Isosphaeraceae bacterium]
MRCHYACGSVEHLVSRRRFLGDVAAGFGAAAGLSSFTAPAIAAELDRKQRQVLVIFLYGGASQLETWDPKPKTDTGGPFRSIETSVAGVRISELMPRTARQMHRLAVVRSLNTHEDDHGKGQYLMNTGRRQAPGTVYPHLGSAMARYLGDAGNPLPGYVRIQIGGGGRGSSEAAYLGPRYNPLYLGGGGLPANTAADPALSSAGAAGREALRMHVNDRFAHRRRTAETEAYTTTFDQAQQLMARRDAFDVSREPARDVDRYGTFDFGRHCLLARRLLRAGVTFVQVNHFNYDTHNENFEFHLQQVGEFDQGFAALIEDLAVAGQLQHTLVAVVSEFGRTPKINYLYGRDHWSRAWSICLAGAGIKPGVVLGKTNARGTEVVDAEVGAGAVFHTCFRAVGLDPTESFEADGRAIQLADPTGKAIAEVLA